MCETTSIKEPNLGVDPWYQKLLRWMFKVDSADLMSESEFNEATPLIVNYFWRSLIFGGLLGILATVGSFLLIIKIYHERAGEVVNPVIDERWYWAWLMPCLFGVFGLFELFEIVYRSKLNPTLGHILYRYRSTEYRWNARSVALFGAIFSILLSVTFSVMMMGTGLVIDEKGILSSNSLILTRKEYADVSQIASYESFDAPIGLRHVRNIVITFRTGEKLKLIGEDRYDPEKLDLIVNYVSAQTGLIIERGDKRPSD